MQCLSCNSENQKQLHAEINIHLPGLRSLNKPGVLVFPIITVCLDCGFAEFRIAEREVQQLSERIRECEAA